MNDNEEEKPDTSLLHDTLDTSNISHPLTSYSVRCLVLICDALSDYHMSCILCIFSEMSLNIILL
jgi:hypothetical protein